MYFIFTNSFKLEVPFQELFLIRRNLMLRDEGWGVFDLRAKLSLESDGFTKNQGMIWFSQARYGIMY